MDFYKYNSLIISNLAVASLWPNSFSIIILYNPSSLNVTLEICKILRSFCSWIKTVSVDVKGTPFLSQQVEHDGSPITAHWNRTVSPSSASLLWGIV